MCFALKRMAEEKRLRRPQHLYGEWRQAHEEAGAPRLAWLRVHGSSPTNAPDATLAVAVYEKACAADEANLHAMGIETVEEMKRLATAHIEQITKGEETPHSHWSPAAMYAWFTLLLCIDRSERTPAQEAVLADLVAEGKHARLTVKSRKAAEKMKPLLEQQLNISAATDRAYMASEAHAAACTELYGHKLVAAQLQLLAAVTLFVVAKEQARARLRFECAPRWPLPITAAAACLPAVSRRF
jgi:hypothetical protein